jgi:hypothetical protein
MEQVQYPCPMALVAELPALLCCELSTFINNPDVALLCYEAYY